MDGEFQLPAFEPKTVTEDKKVTGIDEINFSDPESRTNEKVSDTEMHVSEVSRDPSKLERIEAILKGTSMDSQQLKKSMNKISEFVGD